ncbi:hypothetical protein PoB_005428400 [Plakobranchus ocellatus]|uniref:Uncharacterized protein n=1 Tax=Plakobranchus ocellatus TaxID=259542 RepID=A0AAV4CAP6_9GAST|nr:hypothetical protein PoB_005428400 [Plakobranchus ocellatus]
MGDNESEELVDSEENDGEMGEVTFHDFQPVILLVAKIKWDADIDISGEEEENIEECNPAPDVCGHPKREQNGDLHLCPPAKLQRGILSTFQ